ncbi:MAG: response regulator [Deltaproteobacteria bacterium]|nr:response regulator [Deltaproteobacteria bacterium]
MTHILVIDDETSVRTLMRQVLEEEGYQVDEAGDGEEGLARLQATLADLVITDIFMPHKEGIETIRELRHRFPGVKIVAISGGGRQSRLEPPLSEAQLFGAHHTLAKPFTPQELLAVVNTTLSQ